MQHEPKIISVEHVRNWHIAGGRINDKLAVWLTQHVGSMTACYCFFILAMLGFPLFVPILGSQANTYVLWASSEMIQLVMLPVILVGSNILGKHNELMSEEQYKTTMKSYSDLEKIMKDLSLVINNLEVQDTELYKQTSLLVGLSDVKKVTPVISADNPFIMAKKSKERKTK